MIMYLSLQHNNLSGDIVDLMVRNQGPGNWSTFELRLQNNRFTGDLSRIVNTSFDKFPLLNWLDLSNNNLRWSTSELMPDPIQATLERMTANRSLLSFLVAGNNFSATSLPKTCFVNRSSHHGLLQLDLSNCHLNGEVLGAVFSSSCLPRLYSLDLSDNDISGPVPNSIVMLPSLEALDVSNNHLSGALPAIPQNSSLSGNATIFDGNPGLCGTPLPRACPVPGSGVPWWVLLVTISGSLTIALLSCLAATWRWRVYRRWHQQDADLIKTLLERDSATLMTLRELRKATSDFAESAQIGQGGFATVYRGKLNDGTTVAIKKSKRERSEKDKEQFLNEVRILSHVNHRNLVKLIGCCMENKVALLVFEYVSNGTLQEHLQGKMGETRLTWEQRLKIAVQTADALNYLHTAATFPIYHRDVKSANILLNDDLDAKVADFGISRLAPLQATHVSTAAVQGTLGYIDPEYYTSFRLTDKSDVYSLGVVLLELISAKPAVDFLKVGEESSLVILARPYMERGNLEGLIDPALTETYCDSARHGRESILNVGRLAMECAEMRSKARPSMSEVLQELQNLWVMLNSRTTDLDSMSPNDDDVDAHRDHLIPFSGSLSHDSCSLTIGDDTHGVELSQFSSPRGLQ